MEIESKFGYLIIDGKYYEEDRLDGKPIFKEVSKAKVKKNEKMSQEIAEKIEKSLDRKAVITEAVMRLPPAQIVTLHNVVFNSKRKASAKTRDHHCVDLKVGNFILPIVE